jgi:putative redox protein
MEIIMNAARTRIVHASATSNAGDPAYVHKVQCGRHALLADEPAVRGGMDAGPPPFGYVMSGLAACTSITLRMYAERKGWDLGTVTVAVDLWRAQDVDRIERKVSFSGALDGTQRAKLAEICERTPVTLALKQGLTISTEITV